MESECLHHFFHVLQIRAAGKRPPDSFFPPTLGLVVKFNEVICLLCFYYCAAFICCIAEYLEIVQRLYGDTGTPADHNMENSLITRLHNVHACRMKLKYDFGEVFKSESVHTQSRARYAGFL